MTAVLDPVAAPAEGEDAPRTLRTFLSRKQGAVFTDPARHRVLIAGRKFGKTHLAGCELMRAALSVPRSRNWYVAPTWDQAKDIAWDEFKAIIPRDFWAGPANESTLTIRLLNGATIALRSADNPNRLLGVTLDFLVLDEFAYIPEVVWERALSPNLTLTGGRTLFISTPSGFNWAHKLYWRGQAGAEGQPGWRSWQFTTLDGGLVAPAELEEKRRTTDARMFRQEYEASFETLAGRVYDYFVAKPWPEGNIDAGVRDDGGEILIGMDFNVNPMSFIVAQRRVDECHVLDAVELPVSNTEDVAAEIRRRYPDRYVCVCPDPSGRARHTSAVKGQTDFTILKSHGLHVEAPGAAPLVTDRINNTQRNILAGDRRRLKVHPRALPLIRALEGLTYVDNKPDKAKGLDHQADSLGYLLWQRFNLVQDRRLKVAEFLI